MIKKSLFIGAWLGVLCFGNAKADIYNSFVRIDCMPEISRLFIRSQTFEGTDIFNYLSEKGSDVILKKYGMLSPETLVKRDDMMEVISLSSYKTSCKIGDNVFDITIEPDIILQTGYCYNKCFGSFSVSVSVNSKELVHHLTSCACEDEEELDGFGHIEISINPKNPKDNRMIITGDYIILDKRYNDEKDFTPINYQNFYIPQVEKLKNIKKEKDDETYD